MLRSILLKLPSLLSKGDLRILDRAIHEFVYEQHGYPEHSHYAYWERQAQKWKHSVPPVRPSEGELDIFTSFISEKKDAKKILILGSTPEIRDLVAKECNADVYVADFSFNMIISMLALTNNVEQLSEKWTKDNWIDLAFPEIFFDIIIGDVVLHQLTPEYEEQFLTKMSSMLKDDGRFITRLFFLDDEFLQTDISEIVTKTLSSSESYDEKTTLLWLQLVWRFSDLNSRKYNRQKTLEAFTDFLESRGKEDKVMSFVKQTLTNDANSYRDWSPPSKTALSELTDKYFVRVSETTADDYIVSRFFPIVSMKKS